MYLDFLDIIEYLNLVKYILKSQILKQVLYNASHFG